MEEDATKTFKAREERSVPALRASEGRILSCGSAGKESTCNAEHLGSTPGLGRSPEGGKGYPLQYSGLENSMSYVVHGVTKNQTRLSDFHNHNADGLMAQ